MSASLDTMAAANWNIEQRVFELLGEHRMALEIATELDMTMDEAVPIILKVLEERGTPQLVAIDRHIDRLAAIRF